MDLKVDGCCCPIFWTYGEHSGWLHLCLSGCVRVQIECSFTPMFCWTKSSIGGSLLCRSTQFSKEDNWLCRTISPSRWYTGQLWQSRTSSPAALPPPNLSDLNLLLPNREESWEVDTFKFHILNRLINSLSGWAWIQSCMKQSEMALMLQCCVTMTLTLNYTVSTYSIQVKPPWLDTCQ